MGQGAGRVNPTRIGPNGLALIRKWEGLALKAYPDPGSHDGNPWTIGYGCTGSNIKKGLVWTEQQCEAELAGRLCAYEAAVRDGVGTKPTTQNQFDAMVALCFNIGIAAFKASTVLRKHNAADYMAAAAAFGMWDKNAGRVMRGLVNRRAAEAALYRTPSE